MSTETAGKEYVALRNGDDLLELIEGLDDAVPVEGGVWIRAGRYRLKHGSFIDPSDLSCYGAQYYEPDEDAGRHRGLQLVFGDEAPEGFEALSSVGQLRRLAAGEADEAPCKLLQRSDVFELHGKTTVGWRACVETAEDGSASVAFR